jgi:hypothetical protein
MVVDDLDIGRTRIRPHESKPELIIAADAVLALSGSPQRLEPIAGRGTQEFQGSRGIQLRQLAHRYIVECPEASRAAPFKQCLRTLAPEGLNHATCNYVSRNTSIDAGRVLRNESAESSSAG